MSCGFNEKHTVVPAKGERGDSSGYMSFAPEVNEKLIWRFRLPFDFTLVRVCIDSMVPGDITFRKGVTAALLEAAAAAPLGEATPFEDNETVEITMLTTAPHAVVTFQVQPIVV